MATHKVVKHDEWLKARKKHLAKEKEFTRMRDQLSRHSRCFPRTAPAFERSSPTLSGVPRYWDRIWRGLERPSPGPGS